MTDLAPPPGPALVKWAWKRHVAANIARRARVLSHDDLRTRLLEPPLSYDVAGNWNGNLGPDDFNGLPNDDARHLALVELAREAKGRET